MFGERWRNLRADSGAGLLICYRGRGIQLANVAGALAISFIRLVWSIPWDFSRSIRFPVRWLRPLNHLAPRPESACEASS
jgi:hypothetical protein